MESTHRQWHDVRVQPDMSTFVRETLIQTPKVALERFPDGRVGKVVGRVAADALTIAAPLSGTPCVYARLQVQLLDEVTQGWFPVCERIDSSGFTIADSSGDARVDAARAHVSLITDIDTLTRPRAARPEIIEPLLRQHTRNFRYWVSATPLCYSDGRLLYQVRCLEGSIKTGERLAIHGYGMREVRKDPDAVTGYRSQLPTQLVFRAQRSAPLLLSDRPQTFR